MSWCSTSTPTRRTSRATGRRSTPTTFPDGRALSRAFADFLHKAVQPDGERRFQSARAMREALQAIEAYSGPVAVEGMGVDPAARLTLTADERAKPNYNPYVTRLLTLDSQARHTNAGTRGLDEIAKLTYVKTRLDERLAPEIVDGDFRLVLISGNAGDGKTAFLQQLEQQFEARGVAVARARSSASWTHDGLAYRSNYDASQDDEDRRSDAVLEDFFAPFAGTLGGLMTGARCGSSRSTLGAAARLLPPRPAGETLRRGSGRPSARTCTRGLPSPRGCSWSTSTSARWPSGRGARRATWRGARWSTPSSTPCSTGPCGSPAKAARTSSGAPSSTTSTRCATRPPARRCESGCGASTRWSTSGGGSTSRCAISARRSRGPPARPRLRRRGDPARRRVALRGGAARGALLPRRLRLGLRAGRGHGGRPPRETPAREGRWQVEAPALDRALRS